MSRTPRPSVSGVCTHGRDEHLATAGLRGSCAAQPIDRPGANDQREADVRRLLHTGSVD